MKKKKNILFFSRLFLVSSLFSLSFFLLTSHTSAFLDGNLDLDFYAQIEAGIDDLEKKQLEYEISGWDNSLADKLNTYAQKKNIGLCFIGNITLADLELVINGSIQTLNKICPDTLVNITTVATYQKLIKEFQEEKKDIADSKIQEITKISNIGLYADGDRNNSSFDIVSDLEDIDTIIFTQDSEYNGEYIRGNSGINVYDNIDSFLSGDDDFFEQEKNRIAEDNRRTGTMSNEWELLPEISPWNTLPDAPKQFDGNVYTCPAPLDTSWFSADTLLALQENVEESQNSSWNNNTNDDENTSWENNDDSSTGNSSGEDSPYESGSYSRINDNSVWPCNTFFCINISVIWGTQKLLTGGSSVSIQYLLERSNNHLYKFVNSSLAQAKMTTNNSELWLRDLDLPGMFNTGIHLQYKSPPLLNIEPSDKKDSEDFTAAKKMMEKYFAEIWMDYARQNDLSVLYDESGESRSLNNITTIRQAVDNFNTRQDQRIAGNASGVISQAIDIKIQQDLRGDFKNHFLELDKFLQSLRDYSYDMTVIAKSLDNKNNWW